MTQLQKEFELQTDSNELAKLHYVKSTHLVDCHIHYPVMLPYLHIDSDLYDEQFDFGTHILLTSS